MRATARWGWNSCSRAAAALPAGLHPLKFEDEQVVLLVEYLALQADGFAGRDMIAARQGCDACGVSSIEPRLEVAQLFVLNVRQPLLRRLRHRHPIVSQPRQLPSRP